MKRSPILHMKSLLARAMQQHCHLQQNHMQNSGLMQGSSPNISEDLKTARCAGGCDFESKQTHSCYLKIKINVPGEYICIYKTGVVVVWCHLVVGWFRSYHRRAALGVSDYFGSCWKLHAACRLKESTFFWTKESAGMLQPSFCQCLIIAGKSTISSLIKDLKWYSGSAKCIYYFETAIMLRNKYTNKLNVVKWL